MKYFTLLLFILIGGSTLFGQDPRPKINDFLNKEFFLDNGWAGESLTLKKRGAKYIMVRKMFGSGVPVSGLYEYAVEYDSPYQIRFSKIIGPAAALEAAENTEETLPQGEFRIRIEENGVSIFMNNLKLVIIEQAVPSKG